MTRARRVAIGLVLSAVSLSAGSCHGAGPFEVNGTLGGSWTVAVGREIQVTLGTVGPGEYVSPPAIAGTSVSFVSVTYSDLVVPSGVTQLFHFRAVRSGVSTLTFHHTSPAGSYHPDVADTITVR